MIGSSDWSVPTMLLVRREMASPKDIYCSRFGINVKNSSESLKVRLLPFRIDRARPAPDLSLTKTSKPWELLSCYCQKHC